MNINSPSKSLEPKHQLKKQLTIGLDGLSFRKLQKHCEQKKPY